MENYYVMNKETQKLELHFNKDDYLALSGEQKQSVKSNFLFSRKSGAWVSRAKFPNLYRAEEVAKKLGLENAGKIGEKLFFEEQMERKAERAEARAERYDYKSERAVETGKSLQKPINDMHGDIAFFTQPNINSSAGRAFTRRRERMFAAYERGFAEFKKSEYYAEKAATARETASNTKPTDKAFCDRRIKEAEKTIRAQRKNIDSYKKYLERIESGEVIKRYSGEVLTTDVVNEWIENAEDIIDNAISKSVYYHECLENLGGVSFSKDNIKVGYIVDVDRYGKCQIISAGKVNVSFIIPGKPGYGGTVTYAEINSIIDANAYLKESPFNVGETYTVKVMNGWECVDKEYTVTKVAPGKVTLKCGNERAVSAMPFEVSKHEDGKIEWRLSLPHSVSSITKIV